MQIGANGARHINVRHHARDFRCTIFASPHESALASTARLHISRSEDGM
jgi:hypothetical protein